jgi:hypothetical protein
MGALYYYSKEDRNKEGKYVAAGCNKSAQIYDVQTGEKLCVLQDNSVDISGDLYILHSKRLLQPRLRDT